MSPEIDITVPGHPIHSNWTVHTAGAGKQLGYKVQVGTESRKGGMEQNLLDDLIEWIESKAVLCMTAWYFTSPCTSA